jgi:hypothetical protein
MGQVQLPDTASRGLARDRLPPATAGTAMTAPTSANLLRTDWSWVIGETRRRLAAQRPAPEEPAAVIPCALAVTGKHGSNGKILNVRCRCQAGTRKTPKERFFGYDLIGEAASLTEAAALWRSWHAERGVIV